MYGLEYIDIIKARNNGKIPIDQLWNIHDNGFFEWWDIPGFNGYQMSCEKNSNVHFIRSFKYKQYQYGILLLPRNHDPLNPDLEKVIYQLTDNDNMRINISVKDIYELVKNNHRFPYPTSHAYQFFKPSRNKRLGINQDPELTAQKKGLVRKSVPVNKKENTAMAKFTVTDNPKPLDSY